MNKQQIIGNVGKVEPLAYTPSGTAVLKFSMATNEKVKRNGQDEQHTEWFNCVMFGKRAEGVAPYISKGSKLFVEGPTRKEKYTGSDSVERLSVEVLVNELEFLSSRNNSSSQQTESPTQGQQSSAPVTSGGDDDWGGLDQGNQ